MKRILFAAAILLTSTLTFAQVPVPQQEPATHTKHAANPHKAAMKISNELGLSADQESRLEPILADRQQKVAAVRADTTLTEANRRQQLKTIHHTANLQMKAVLSADQLKQLRAMHRNHEAAETSASL